VKKSVFPSRAASPFAAMLTRGIRGAERSPRPTGPTPVTFLGTINRDIKDPWPGNHG
jgi:hypothetical protein